MFQQVENYVDDCLQDEYARLCGLPSRIGRRCLLDDHVLARVLGKIELSAHSNVLDLGSEPGFLRRWLRWSSAGGPYIRVDSRHRNSLRQAGSRYERVVAIEPNLEGEVSVELASSIAESLAPRGRYAVTLASFDGKHFEKVSASIARLQACTSDLQQSDLTAQVKQYAGTLYNTLLLCDWERYFKTFVLEDATRVLSAIQTGAFNYSVITGSAQAD